MQYGIINAALNLLVFGVLEAPFLGVLIWMITRPKWTRSDGL